MNSFWTARANSNMLATFGDSRPPIMSDFILQPISVGSLLLDVGNYRIVPQTSQKAARDAIIAEEGRKLVVLAKDILSHGTSPFDLTMVLDADNGSGDYIVLEGNRRLTALQLLRNPALAEGTSVHTAFKKLNAERQDAIPQTLQCSIAPNREEARIWIRRKHGSGLDGAGTEHWSSISKARADVAEGIPRPDLDVVNFVLTNPSLDPEVRKHLEGSEFSITTLNRLLESKEVQQVIGIAIEDDKIVTDQSKERIQGVFSEITTVIAKGSYKNKKFTERNIDTSDRQEEFVTEIAKKHAKKIRGAGSWSVSGKPIPVARKSAKQKGKSTPSTEQRQNLIPRAFKLELPAGKINDVFVELKKLDVVRHRHAVSVLFRVFFEFSLDHYITRHAIKLPTDNAGRVKDSLPVRVEHVKAHVKQTKLMNEHELKPLNVAMAGKDSLLAPDTINAYVHSPWMNPDPLQLKISWNNLQLFIERIWYVVK